MAEASEAPSLRRLERAVEQVFTDAIYRFGTQFLERKIAERGITLTPKQRRQLQSDLLKGNLRELEFDEDDLATTGRQESIEISPREVRALRRRIREALKDTASELPAALADQAVSIDRRLRAAWNAEAKRQAATQRGFGRRLQRGWREPLNSLAMLITMCVELGGDLNEHLRSERRRPQQPYLIEVMTRLHARACQVSSEVLVLLQHGFADGAMARWRTLHELTVTAMFIREHGESIARRYLDHDVIERHKANTIYIVHQARLGLTPLTTREQTPTRRAHQKAMNRHGPGYGRDYGWALPKLAKLKPGASPRFSDIVDAVDMRHMAPYYKLACGRVHANAHGMLFVLGMDPASSLLLVGPSTRGLSEPGQNTALSLAQITSELAQLYRSLDVSLLLAVIRRVSESTRDQFAGLAPEPPAPDPRARRRQTTNALRQKDKEPQR